MAELNRWVVQRHRNRLCCGTMREEMVLGMSVAEQYLLSVTTEINLGISLATYPKSHIGLFGFSDVL